MKRKIFFTILMILIIGIIVSFVYAQDKIKFVVKQNVALSKDMPLIRASDKFGIDIFKQEIKGNKNVVISPISLFTVFNIAASGASGETEKQMKSVTNVSNYSVGQLNDGMTVPELLRIIHI